MEDELRECLKRELQEFCHPAISYLEDMGYFSMTHLPKLFKDNLAAIPLTPGSRSALLEDIAAFRKRSAPVIERAPKTVPVEKKNKAKAEPPLSQARSVPDTKKKAKAEPPPDSGSSGGSSSDCTSSDTSSSSGSSTTDSDD